MGKILQAIWSFVTSRNVAIVLLIVVTCMLAVGAFLPNPVFLTDEQKIEMKIANPSLYWLGERFNSQSLASGRVFGFIGTFLILSTALCSIDRLITKMRAKAGALFTFPDATSQEGIKKSFQNIHVSALEGYGREWFNKQKWKVTVQGDALRKTIVGSRGNAGFWGSIFFHFILITALMGLVIYYFGSYRATLGFTEGQSYRLHKDRLVHILEEPVWGLSLPDAEVGLVKQYSIYAEDEPLYPIEHVAVFRVYEFKKNRSWDKEVRINDPLVIDGKTFLLQRGGFSGKIVLKNSDGVVVFDTFVALRNKRGTADDVTIEGENIHMEVSFYPDFIKKGTRYETKSLQVRNPFYWVKAYRGDTLFFDKLVPLNVETKAGEYLLGLPEIRRWVEIELVGEPGIGFFFIVSFIGLIGVFVRVIDPDERIYIILEEMKSNVEMTTYTYSKHFAGLIEDKRNEMVTYIEERVG
jgi:hypothetical protein